MGSFIGNTHVKGSALAQVQAAVAGLASEFQCAGPQDDWTHVYEARCAGQDAEWIRTFTVALSKALSLPVVSFMVHDSDVLLVWVADKGQLSCHINTFPEMFDLPGEEPLVESIGGFNALCPEVEESRLLAIIRTDAVFADDILSELARLLGIGAEHVLQDHRTLPVSEDRGFRSRGVGGGRGQQKRLREHGSWTRK